MNNQEIVTWSGHAFFNSTNKELLSRIGQKHFFIPGNVLFSRYGVVAMLVVDAKPKKRNISYCVSTDVGVPFDEEWVSGLVGCQDDPIRKAHFEETEKGFSLLRVFVLPVSATQIFARDTFLGEPMIAKCACNNVFNTNVHFDEETASPEYYPVKDAVPLIEAATLGIYRDSGLEAGFDARVQTRTWISFHGWFAFTEALAQAEVSLQRSLDNFDLVLRRAALEQMTLM